MAGSVVPVPALLRRWRVGQRVFLNEGRFLDSVVPVKVPVSILFPLVLFFGVRRSGVLISPSEDSISDARIPAQT